MAKKQRRKIKKRAAREKAQFFESLPMATPMPTFMPESGINFDEGFELARDLVRAGASDLRNASAAVWKRLHSKFCQENLHLINPCHYHYRNYYRRCSSDYHPQSLRQRYFKPRSTHGQEEDWHHYS